MAYTSDSEDLASQKVLETFELLERILLYLPLRDLLLAQRINRATSDVIDNSPDIQRALFLKPSARVVHAFSADEGEDIVYPPSHPKWRADQDSEAVKPIINPFIAVHRIKIHIIKAEIENKVQREGCMLYGTGNGPVDSYACLKARASDTRFNMLITHPPVACLKIQKWGGGPRGVVRTSAGAVGIRHGELFKYCSSGKKQKNKSTFHGLEQAVTWKPLIRGIDSITGVEMLEILSRKPVESGGELRGGYGEDSDWESEVSGESDHGDSDEDSDDSFAGFGALSEYSGSSGYGASIEFGAFNDYDTSGQYGTPSNYGADSQYGGSNYGGLSNFGGSNYGGPSYGGLTSRGSRGYDASSEFGTYKVVRKSVLVRKSVVVRQAVVVRKGSGRSRRTPVMGTGSPVMMERTLL